MADGYARASGNFGAALCIGGPGLGNMTTALATALTDQLPGSRTERRGRDRDGRNSASSRTRARYPSTTRASPVRSRVSRPRSTKARQSQSSVPPSACGHAWAARGAGSSIAALDVVTGEVGARRPDRPRAVPLGRARSRSGRAGGRADDGPGSDRSANSDRPARRRRGRACRGGRRARGRGGEIPPAGGDHAAGEGRVPGGSSAVPWRVRLRGHAACHGGTSVPRPRPPGRARLRAQRA